MELATNRPSGSSARYMRRGDAARYLTEVWGIRRAPTTLAKLATIGGGPKFSKAGKWPLYRPEDLDAWATALLSNEPAAD